METQNPIKGYRSYLRDILIEKQKKNSQYSLRSLAKALGLQSSFLSMVLTGKRDLSEDKASEISEKLGLTAVESKRFNLLLRLEKSTQANQRKTLLDELKVLDPSYSEHRDLAVEQFKVISEWYHLPLQLLVELEGFEWSEEAAAKALGITVHEVRDALERLNALELIEWEVGTKPKKVPGRFIVSSSLKNEALQKYHRQMLEKTATALVTQAPSERFTGTLNLTFDEKQFTEACQVLDEAYEKLASISEKRSKSKQIYHANLNLFKLTQNQNQRKGNQK